MPRLLPQTSFGWSKRSAVFKCKFQFSLAFSAKIWYYKNESQNERSELVYPGNMHLHAQIKQQIEQFESIKHEYPHLAKAGTPIEYPSAPIMGRDTSELREALRTPEKANVILLGDPGSGKTAFMQGFTYDDSSIHYLTISVNVEKIIENNQGDKDAELANGLQNLVAEVSRYCKEQNVIMILFIDEFHRIAMLSPTAVEAMKPILEKSAYNGFRIVAATTFEEYDQWIAPNRALDQRLLRMTIAELPREAVINILKSRAKQHNVAELAEDGIFDEIYDISKEILLSNSQPRASIDIFNSLIGAITKDEYMENGKLIRTYSNNKELGIPGDKPLCRHTLNKVIRRAYGIDIDNRVKVNDIRKALETRIYNQDFAVSKVMNRLEMILAGFNDPTRPRGSLLFTGPTGTGKTELTKVVSETMGIPLKRFDMSRYSRPEDAVAFADDLAQAAWSAPNGLILIDEIEKSSREAINNLLQVLDDARLTAKNNPNRVISFTGNIIFITTNLASEIYQHMKQFDGQSSDIDVELVYKALADDDRFETAVLGRLDDIVPFLGLPEHAMMKIAQRELTTNLNIIETDKRRVLISPDIIPYIVKDRTSQDNERGGARDAKRNVKSVVLQKVAHYLANEPDEKPIILHLVGKARFLHSEILDPLSADVELVECHPQANVDHWIKQLSDQLHVVIKDEGIFIPQTWSSQDFARVMVTHIRNGVRRFKTHISEEHIWIDRA